MAFLLETGDPADKEQFISNVNNSIYATVFL
jgi:hypothetical protein